MYASYRVLVYMIKVYSVWSEVLLVKHNTHCWSGIYNIVQYIYHIVYDVHGRTGAGYSSSSAETVKAQQ